MLRCGFSRRAPRITDAPTDPHRHLRRADVVRTALERVRVLEAREEDARRALIEGRAELKALATRVEAIERSGAGTGVTITAVHKVAAAALGLVTLALVALVGFLWRR